MKDKKMFLAVIVIGFGANIIATPSRACDGNATAGASLLPFFGDLMVKDYPCDPTPPAVPTVHPEQARPHPTNQTPVNPSAASGEPVAQVYTDESCKMQASAGDVISIGDRVYHPDQRYPGLVKTITNGIAEVHFDHYIEPTDEPVASLSKLVACLGPFHKGVRVYHPHYQDHIGTVKEVFANGIARVAFDGFIEDSYIPVRSLSFEVRCLGAICKSKQVTHPTYGEGSVNKLFSNGLAKVHFGWHLTDTYVSVTSLSPMPELAK